MGLFLGLAAGLGYFLAARPMAAWLAMGAGAVLAAAWLNFLQRRASHRQQLSGLEAEKQRADAALAAAQDALEQSRANLEHLQEEWRARLPEGALPATLTPEAVLELLQGIERLKENLENLQETRRA